MRDLLSHTIITVVASALMLVGALVAGTILKGASPETPEGETICLEERVVPVAGVAIRGLGRVCIGEAGANPEVKLTGLQAGNLYTTWLAYSDRVLTPRATRNGGSAQLPGIPPGAPGRMGGIVADQTGSAQLGSEYQGLHLTSGSELQILIVDHGKPHADDPRARAAQVISWQSLWWDDPSPGTRTPDDNARLVGYVVFRLRGGTETTGG